MDAAWRETQEKINIFLEGVLSKVEWEYGDCRAPYKWPARFEKTVAADGKALYVCEIELEDGGGEKISAAANRPEELFGSVRRQIDKLTGMGGAM